MYRTVIFVVVKVINDLVLIGPCSLVVCKVMRLFAPCRNGWILCHRWVQTDEDEKSGRHKNVRSPDPHACSCPRLCGGSHDCWYVSGSAVFSDKILASVLQFVQNCFDLSFVFVF